MDNSDKKKPLDPEVAEILLKFVNSFSLQILHQIRLNQGTASIWVLGVSLAFVFTILSSPASVLEFYGTILAKGGLTAFLLSSASAIPNLYGVMTNKAATSIGVQDEPKTMTVAELEDLTRHFPQAEPGQVKAKILQIATSNPTISISAYHAIAKFYWDTKFLWMQLIFLGIGVSAFCFHFFSS